MLASNHRPLDGRCVLTRPVSDLFVIVQLAQLMFALPHQPLSPLN
jgi:hypothetical protein